MDKAQSVSARIAGAMLVALFAFTNAAAQDKLQEKGAGFNDAVITELVTSALHNAPVLREMRIAVSHVRNSIRVTDRPSRA